MRSPSEMTEGWKRIVRATADKIIALAREASARTGLSVDEVINVFISPKWLEKATEGLPLGKEVGGKTPADLVREVSALVNLERNMN